MGKRGPKPGSRAGEASPNKGVETQNRQLARIEGHRIASSPNAPLKVMLRNMMFWVEHANTIQAQVEQMLPQITEAIRASNGNPAALDAVNEMLEKAKTLTREFLTARHNSQTCAVDAAPYIHPKLASVSFKKGGEAPKVLIVETVVPSSTGLIGGDDSRLEEVPKTNGSAKISADSEPDRSYRDGYKSDRVLPVRRVG